MNEKHLLLAALAPTAMSLIGIIFAKVDLKEFKVEVRSRLDRLETKIDTVEATMNTVIVANHEDALEIMRTMIALHERIAVVEAKQK